MIQQLTDLIRQQRWTLERPLSRGIRFQLTLILRQTQWKKYRRQIRVTQAQQVLLDRSNPQIFQ